MRETDYGLAIGDTGESPVGRRGWAGNIPAHLHHQPALPLTSPAPSEFYASQNTEHVKFTPILKVGITD